MPATRPQAFSACMRPCLCSSLSTELPVRTGRGTAAQRPVKTRCGATSRVFRESASPQPSGHERPQVALPFRGANGSADVCRVHAVAFVLVALDTELPERIGPDTAAQRPMKTRCGAMSRIFRARARLLRRKMGQAGLYRAAYLMAQHPGTAL